MWNKKWKISYKWGENISKRQNWLDHYRKQSIQILAIQEQTKQFSWKNKLDKTLNKEDKEAVVKDVENMFNMSPRNFRLK